MGDLMNLLSCGAERYRDDCFRVALQGAGAASYCSHPEHCLGLVHHREHLLRLHTQAFHTHLQRRHHLCILHKEQQWHWLLLCRTRGNGQ